MLPHPEPPEAKRASLGAWTANVTASTRVPACGKWDVEVRDMSGRTVRRFFEGGTCIEDVKLYLVREWGRPTFTQKLILDGCALEDHASLSSLDRNPLQLMCLFSRQSWDKATFDTKLSMLFNIGLSEVPKGEPLVVEMLRDAMDKHDGRLRQAAAEAMAKIGGRGNQLAIDALLAHGEDTQGYVRIAVLEALSEVGGGNDGGIIDLAIKRVSDQSWMVRLNALILLRRLATDLTPLQLAVIAEGLQDAEDSVREEALLVFGECAQAADQKTQARLKRFSGDEHPGVRYATRRALAKVREKQKDLPTPVVVDPRPRQLRATRAYTTPLVLTMLPLLHVLLQPRPCAEVPAAATAFAARQHVAPAVALQASARRRRCLACRSDAGGIVQYLHRAAAAHHRRRDSLFAVPALLGTQGLWQSAGGGSPYVGPLWRDAGATQRCTIVPRAWRRRGYGPGPESKGQDP